MVYGVLKTFCKTGAGVAMTIHGCKKIKHPIDKLSYIDIIDN